MTNQLKNLNYLAHRVDTHDTLERNVGSGTKEPSGCRTFYENKPKFIFNNGQRRGKEN